MLNTFLPLRLSLDLSTSRRVVLPVTATKDRTEITHKITASTSLIAPSINMAIGGYK